MSMINETVLITGATSGIGYELGKLFAKDRASMVLVSRSDERLRAVSKEFLIYGATKVYTINKDLSYPGAASEVYNETQRGGMDVSVLVNDAGVGELGLFSETELDKEDMIINLNIVSVVHLTKYYLRHMLEKNSGRIMNVASIASYQPTPRLAVYSASKAFVLSFTDSLIYETKDTGVTVTALIPGPTDTDFFRKAHMENTKAAIDNPQDPAEVAEAGYKGLLRGTHHVTPKFSVRAQVAMSNLMPNEAVSSMASTFTKEKKRKK